MLQALGERMLQGKQGLLSVTIVRVKGIWQGNALRLRGQGILHDLGIPDVQATQTTIPQNAAYQTDDLDAYDSDCDDISSAKAVLMANLSSYNLDVLSEQMQQSFIHEYNENLVLKAELAKKEHMVEKKLFNEVEVLDYVTAICPSLTKPSEKLVVITPLNKNKKVSSTSASRSQPSGNTKKNRISQTTSSNMENKVGDHPRSAKSTSNKIDHVIEPICNANVKHSMLNSNSELTHATCNECMFDVIHDLCVLDFVNDVNVRSKSKSAKSSKKKKIWKPTGKVYTDIGYRWKRIGRTFTLFGNACPLTRFTFTRVVPLKETTSKLVITQNPAIKVYSRRPKVIESVVQIVLWYLDSRCSKHMTGNRSQLINFGHKFFGTVRFGKDQIAKIMGYGDYKMGNVMISQVYYVEGLGHNLFSVSQFCDSDVEVTDIQ
ncbi:hypothetical protein Tco_1271783 [Tanacetum coccineum]